MPKIAYIRKRLSSAKLAVIAQANEIIEQYRAAGYELTLRQLYYQFVARDLIPNSQREYTKLGEAINDARLAGLTDWNAIVDRTRNVRAVSTWDSPEEVIRACAEQFMLDPWKDQDTAIEVWIEKDALVGVIEGPCSKWRVPYFSCRGYTSQSELWRAAQRMIGYQRAGKQPVVLHFGDHDPSGMDMTRDIEDRFALFGASVRVYRKALNMDQVEQYDPPPNPAKLTDTRAEGYIARYGNESWELDALEPSVLDALIQDEIREHVDTEAWESVMSDERHDRETLEWAAENWGWVVDKASER